MQLDVSRELIPLSAPFTITGYTFTEVAVVVARLLDGGARGEGEAAGVYYLNDDTDHMCGAIEAVRREIEAGLDREALRRLLPPGGARNALDCALWDLEAKRAGQPAWRLAGLESPKPLTTTFTIPANDPGAMAAKAVEYAQARSLKLKLTGDPALDAERVRAVRKARPDTWLGVDANQGFDANSLETLMPALVACKVKLVEQPFARGREAEFESLRC
ncbi:MAG: dipeptide epimerase, partial [Gammaproteobacteria bacterium]|nr:dipeptide epimerase [Gammaproteobacteria bacterium]